MVTSWCTISQAKHMTTCRSESKLHLVCKTLEMNQLASPIPMAHHRHITLSLEKLDHHDLPHTLRSLPVVMSAICPTVKDNLETKTNKTSNI